MFRRLLPMLFVAVTGSWAITASASAAPKADHFQRIKYDFVGFTEDAENFVLKVQDPNAGARFLVFDTNTGDMVSKKPITFLAGDEDDEKKALRKVARVHNAKKALEPPAEDAVNPRKKIMMLVGQNKDTLKVFMMSPAGQVIQYMKIPVYKDDKTGDVAMANQKTAVWDRRGKYAVIIYSQKLTADRFNTVDRDYFTAFKVKNSKLKFD